jgi:hypothetical protein
MRARIWILLLLMGFVPSAYLLWQSWKRVDLDIAAHLDAADQERHAYVISPDFDLLKEKLIETHRDHWAYIERLEAQSRWETLCMAGVLGLISILLVREWLKIRSSKKEKVPISKAEGQ